ncbi:MAG: hypothetical protein SNJ29_12150 [Rikenellaceae bacterium]
MRSAFRDFSIMLLSLPSQADSFAPFGKWQDIPYAAKIDFAA